MPVRMRLATKGASRKRKISIERSPELVRGVECLLHLPDEFDGVLRARRNAGPRLHVADHVQVKLFRKVRPRTMIGDDLAAFVWLHLRQPFLVGLLEALFKIRVAMFEIR